MLGSKQSPSPPGFHGMAVKAMLLVLVLVRSCSVLEEDKCQDRYGADLTKNFALGRTASQSSTSNSGDASRLTDGNSNPYFGNNSCSETELGDDVYWEVQFQDEIYITSATITSRADPYWPYSDYFEIKLKKDTVELTTLCTAGVLSSNGETKNYLCQSPQEVTGVKIVLPGVQKRLSLCEVKVHGREMEFFDHEVNYALQQPAKQYYGTGFGRVAARAVDGNRDTSQQSLTCTHTSASPTFHWWKVDLGKNSLVYAVAVTNRATAGGRLKDFEIFVSPSEKVVEERGATCDGRQGVDEGATRAIFCKQPLRGRYVAIVSRLQEVLTFCEVYVQAWEDECVAPRVFGVESFRILDSQMSSSSTHSSGYYLAQNGRLNVKPPFLCWIPSNAERSSWLQVDFLWIVVLTGIQTQGYGNWRVTKYKVSHGGNGIDFQFYAANGVDKLFKANWDADIIASNFLSPAVVARFVRLHPVDYVGYRALRVEFIGCYSGDEGYRRSKPLGMQNYEITETQLNASSSHSNWRLNNGRLNYEHITKAGWMAQGAGPKWMQVDLILMATIVEIRTQGSPNYASTFWCIKTYTVKYGYESEFLQDYRVDGVTKVFSGNFDAYSVVSNPLTQPIVARFVRIYAETWQGHAALRLELVGYYKECANPQPLGMQDGRIVSAQISDSFNHGDPFGPNNARLNWQAGTCWVAYGENQWLQIAFNRFTKVVQILTQGRWGNHEHEQWVKSYYLSYGNDGADFYDYAYRGTTKIFDGNSNKNSVVKRYVNPAIVARYIRIYPRTWKGHIALTVEFIGCYLGYADSCENVPNRKALGMENFQIANPQLSASSQYRTALGSSASRLNYFTSDTSGGSWIPLVSGENQWLQVDFLRTVKVTGLATQGRKHDRHWVKEFTVSYKQGKDDVEFHLYKKQGIIKVFSGNTDQNSINRTEFDPYINARLLRVQAKTWMGHIALRTEFFGFEADLIDGDYADVEKRITASSWLDHRHRPFDGVISGNPDSTSWTPAVEKTKEYIQVDLVQPTPLAGVELRGAADFPDDSYTILFMRYGTVERHWKLLKDKYGKTKTLLTSNCYQEFEYYILARFVRFTIASWGRRTSFRFQLHEMEAYERASVGIEEGIIMDDQLNSSNHPDDPHPAYEGRLNFPGAWCGNTMQKQLFLQVDFFMNFQVHALTTQGKFIDVMEYVSQYKVSSTLDEVHWTFYKEDSTVKVFPGNANCHCSHKNFVQPFLARSLRVLPETWVERPCMRIEVYGAYRGFLKVHARSGTVFNKEGAVVTRQTFIKLNGKEVIDTGPGYNIVVANHITGEFITSTTLHPSTDTEQLNSFLKNISDHSVVVIATQDVNELPSDETLLLLESIGAIKLRYSLTNDHESWILVGYKGKQQVSWTTEEIGKIDEALKIAVFVPLNERDLKPKYEQYLKPDVRKPELTIEGHYTELFYNTSSKCDVNSTDCQEKISLAMWMKNDVPKFTKESTVESGRARFVFKYYSNGHDFMVPKQSTSWNDARRYCEAIRADLAVIPDQHTLNVLIDIALREGISSFHVGLARHPDNLLSFRWVDGSPLVFAKWQAYEPNNMNEQCVVYNVDSAGYNDIDCDGNPKAFVCQQPMEDMMGIEPIGMEADFIPDSSIDSSSILNVWHDKHFARANTQRNTARSWCAAVSDDRPYLQVDLAEISSICGVGTMGRGSPYGYHFGYPISYSVLLSNDSFNWTFVKEGDDRTVFKANEDRNSMVINRFHREFVAQFVKMDFLSWNSPYGLCVRLELFSCKKGEERDYDQTRFQKVAVPVSFKENIPQDCLGVLMSGRTTDGVYMINPGNEGAFPVYCDQTTDGGGWSVFQRRIDGAVDFYRTSDEYAIGFGDLLQEHWLGNENIVRISNFFHSDLRIDLERFSGETSYVTYSNFKMTSARRNYLYYLSNAKGPAGDSMSDGRSKRFSTMDKGLMSTARDRHGAWWYPDYVISNLNGKYYPTAEFQLDSVFWNSWTSTESLKGTKMMLRSGGIGHTGRFGMEDAMIKWKQIFNNSPNKVSGHEDYQARLNVPSKYWIVEDLGYYLEIDFFKSRRISHFATQGGSDLNYVKEFFVTLYDESDFWKDYEEDGQLKIFEGNNERTLANELDTVSNCLYDFGLFRRMRLNLVSCSSSSCSLRMELYFCEDSCSSPLGMSSGRLSNDRINASSWQSSTPPAVGRLSNDITWCAEFSKADEFLELKFLEMVKVTNVATKGCMNNNLPCFVKTYSLMYKNRKRRWIMYERENDRVFLGNVNPGTPIRNKIEKPFLALSLRFVVKTWLNSICLGAEIYGCYPDNPKFVVFTNNAIAGKDFNVKGKYRYCESCECPGCKKSLCVRVFDKVHILAAHFSYDCLYHDFDVPVQASIIPGVHKVYVAESEYSNCTSTSNERVIGTITVSEDYTSCLDLLLSGQTKSGQYSMDPDGNGAIRVYCDQESYGGGWTVFQRRIDANESFARDWATYKQGFGDLERNFWLGNDFIHRLTLIKRELLLDVNSVNGDHAFVLYKSFQISNEEDAYRAHVSEYQESVGNCLLWENGKRFSTHDKDNDNRDDDNCAKIRGSGWWHANCGTCNLNGEYGAGNSLGNMKFNHWSSNQFLNRAEIKIRPKSVVSCNENFCYYLLKSRRHWLTAEEECRTFYAHLVSIHSASENEYIANTILLEENIDEVHLGIRNSTIWTDGSKVLFQNFETSYSNTGCPVLERDGSWKIKNCNETRNVLCKRGKSCFKGQCYIYNAERLSNAAAQGYCRDLGYDLVKISSQMEQDVVKEFIHASIPSSSYPDSIWLGSRRLNDSSIFSWVDGTHVDFNKWKQNEPDEPAMLCSGIQSEGLWEDMSCEQSRTFPCEKVLDPDYAIPKDCLELLLTGTTRSGVYSIDPDGMGAVQVYCDQDTYGGGWIVLTRRVDGSEHFNRTWEEYRNGFGSLDRNFWLGNELIHRLTATPHEALFDIQSDGGDSSVVLYKNFTVDSEEEKYKLTIAEFKSSHRSDSMANSNEMFFTTEDRDNDENSGNCAIITNGGWWYRSCAEAFLTGTYEASDPEYKSRWGGWFLSGAEMKIRRKSIVECKENVCYYWTRRKKSWLDALDECRNLNMDLASVLDTNHNDFIGDHSSVAFGLYEVYLGVGMGDSEKFTDNAVVDFNKNLIEPLPADKCVVLKKDHSWGNVDCNQPKFFVCKRAKYCHKGDCYLRDGTSTEKLYNATVTRCESLGFKLSKITSREEHLFVMKVMRVSTRDSSVPSMFTGLRLVGKEYQWQDGSKFQYNQWRSGQPSGGEEYLTILTTEGFVDVPESYGSSTFCEKVLTVKSCNEVRKHGRSESGYYSLHLGRPRVAKVYCDLSSSDGPWTVIQRRIYSTPPTDYASKTWENYRNGFGESEANFWLGNNYIHELTKIPQRLKITLHTADFNIYEAIYEDFTIGDEASKFVLSFGAYSGTAGDSLSFHRGMKFSTVDQDNDPILTDACTLHHPGGWWFSRCLDSNLNGVFDAKTNTLPTLYWKTISQAIVKTEMKIQAYKKAPDFLPHGVIQNEIALLGFTFTDETMKITMQTLDQHWNAMVPIPGPFLTHMAITWEDNSYLRYYENGSLLAQITAVTDSKLTYPNSTGVQYAWLNSFSYFDKELTTREVKIHYENKILEFEEDSYCWNFTSVSNYTWGLMRGCTPSIHTGPCGDHSSSRSTGSFAYVESSVPAVYGDQAIIKSPVLLGIYKCLSFWYHMFGVGVGSLHVYLQTNSSIYNIPVRNISGNHGNDWRYMEIDVNLDYVFQIVFETIRGDNFQSDIAIDDVTLSAEKCNNECMPPCEAGEKCNHSTLLCYYEGIFDYRWTLDSLNITNNPTISVTGDVKEIEGAIQGAAGLKGDGQIVFQQFKSYCRDSWCFPFFTLSFWLKYEEVASQNILAFGDLVRIVQTSSTPTDHVSIVFNSPTQNCKTDFFVPTEVWSHILVTVSHGFITLYLDGRLLANSTNLQCTTIDPRDYPEINFDAGGSGDVNFALDDVRVLFDVLLKDTVRFYKNKVGHQQTIFIQAKLTSQPWNNDFLNHESDACITLSQLVREKILETLEYRSNLTKVVVERFSAGSVIADVTLVYDDVYYEDILLVEEALHVNNSFNGLEVEGITINSTSVPTFSPEIRSAFSLNSTTIFVNWTDVSSFYLNGIFQGYKLLCRETHNSSFTEYTTNIFYGNHSEFLITELQPFTNYTIRILAFTLSGDGLPSHELSVLTMDGPVTIEPEVSLTNVSSTALYANWTMLPNSTDIYRQLLGYYVYLWKQSDKDNSFVINITTENYIMMEGLEKWTTYCFNVSGYTAYWVGPAGSDTQCARTFEDAPEEQPSNVTLLEVNGTSIKLLWSPPPLSAVPGIIRFYNLSYRLLNDSNLEISKFEHDERTYTIEGLNPYSSYEINISAFTVSTGPAFTLFVLTSEAEPSAAPNVSLLNISSTALEINWTALATPYRNGILLGYRIFMWKESEGSAFSLNTTVAGATYFKRFEELSKWTTYCFQITAFTSVGDGPKSDADCVRTFEDAPEEPPSDFGTLGITSSSIELQWSPPPSHAVPGILRQYNLTYRNLNYTDDHLTELNVSAAVTSHTIDDLIGLTLYEINITSSTIFFGPWDTILVLTEEAVPRVGPNVSWYNLSSTSLQIEINAIPPPLRNGIIMGYRVYFWKQSEGQSSETNNSTTESIKLLEELEKYTDYCGQVAAYTRIGEGQRSPVECIRTSEDAPEVSPTNLNTTNITTSSFYLTWNPIDRSQIPGILRSYRITYKVIDPGYTQFNGLYDGSFLVDSPATSVNVTGLIGLTNYEVMINGVTIIDGPGNFTYLQTEEGIPTAPPEKITVKDVTPTTMILDWSKIALPKRHGIIRGYQLTYEKSAVRNKRDVELETLKFDSNTFTVFLFKLEPYTNYTLTLAGYTSKGMGVKNIWTVETAQGVPSISPKNSYGINFTGPTSIFIGWGPLTTAELQGLLVGYEVRYRIFSIADEIVHDPPPEVVKIVYSDINGIKLTGLSTYSTYTVTVSALSGGGTGVKTGLLYVATCRCFKRLNTNYWNLQPYTNISRGNSFQGLYPYLLEMVTLSCCQNCLEHGASEVIYDRDGEGNPSRKTSDNNVKRNLSLATDFSFPVYGFYGQEWYSKYFGYAPMVDVVGTVFFTKKPDYSTIQGNALLASVLSIMPFLAITMIFAYIAGVIMWALEHGHNEDEFPTAFIRGAASGFWWAYVTMTTVGFGDKTAVTRRGRVFAVVWILVGLVICSLLIGSIATTFTSSTTMPKPSAKTLYGANVAAIHDSPDHKFGVRRTATVNRLKPYWSLEGLKNALLSEKVDGILVDTYVANSRRDLFGDSKLMITQIADLRASYGVVMGEDATKLRKCFKKFWKENNGKRLAYIQERTSAVVPPVVTAEEQTSGTFNPTGFLYQMTLNICLVGLCVGLVCGCVYEVIRKRKRKAKVEPEVASLPTDAEVQTDPSEVLEKFKGRIRKLQAKHRQEIKKFIKVKQKSN